MACMLDSFAPINCCGNLLGLMHMGSGIRAACTAYWSPSVLAPWVPPFQTAARHAQKKNSQQKNSKKLCRAKNLSWVEPKSQFHNDLARLHKPVHR